MHRILLSLSLTLVWGTTAYMSVGGLMALFGASAVIACLATGMELGKLACVIHLHRAWDRLPIGGRAFYMAVIAVLVGLTAIEAAGYLIQGHQQGVAGLARASAEIDGLAARQTILRDRIETIDSTLAGLPPGYVTRRIREREAAGYDALQAELLSVTGRLQDLRTGQVSARAEAGPVAALAHLAGVPADRAMLMLVAILVCVMEPLGLGLAVAASAAWPAGRPKTAKTAEIQTAAGSADPAESARPKTAETRPTRTSIETAENGQNGRNAAKTKTPVVSAAQEEFLAIVQRHGLTAENVAGITGRSKRKTVAAWMAAGGPDIPIKALRLMRRWNARQPSVRLIKMASAGGRP